MHKKLILIMLMGIMIALTCKGLAVFAEDKEVSSNTIRLSLTVYEEAKALYNEGKYQESLEKFKETLEYDPQNSLAQFYIDKIMFKIDANYSAKQMLTKDPEKIDLLVKEFFSQGQKCFENNEYENAITFFKKVWAINPHHKLTPEALMYIDKANQQLSGQSEKKENIHAQVKQPEAIKAIESEVSIETLREMGIEKYKQHKPGQAREIFEKILEKNPNDKEAQRYYEKAKLAEINEKYNNLVREGHLSDEERESEILDKKIFPPDKYEAKARPELIKHKSKVDIRQKLEQPISLDFRDVELGAILDFISTQTGINIVAAPEVDLTVKLNIKLNDMNTKEALKYILKSKGMSFRLDGEVVWVTTPDLLNREELETKVYFLNFASNMYAKFGGSSSAEGGFGGAPAIDKIMTIKELIEHAVNWPGESKITLDERSGAIVVTNTPYNLKIVEDILYNIDISPVQVEIEARFVEIDLGNYREMGVDWKLNSGFGKDTQVLPDVTKIGFTDSARSAEGLNLSIKGVLTHPQYEAALHALAEDSKTKTLSCPKVTTMNNRLATLEVADEWIYPTSYEAQLVQQDVNGDGDYLDAGETKTVNVPKTFAVRNVGIILHVTPSVGIDQETITLALVPEVSEAVNNFFEYSGEVRLPKFTTRNLSTNVTVKNSETVVLGGMIKESRVKRNTKVPVLGDFPILGRLFRKESDSIERSNLMIFVTANILNDSGERSVYQEKKE